MYPISQTYSDYLRRHDAEYVVKVEINGVEYDSSKIVDFIVDNYITNMDELEIGTAIPSMLTLTLRTNEVIPPNAKVIPYIALSMEGLTWQGAEVAWDDADWPWEGGATDWLPLGEFYVDTREKVHDVWTYTCLDKLVFADVPYVSSLTYPTTQKAVWDEICTRLGFTYDSSVVIANYNVPVAPTGYTMRQVMGFIAGANGASVFAGKDGILRFKRYNASDAPQFEMGEADYFRVKQTNPVKSYSRVVVIYDLEDELYYEAGEGSEDQTLYIENPLATQQITNDIYAKINGLYYQPIEMDSKGYPQLDQGDIISFKQSESISWDDAEMSWDDADFAWDGIETYQTIILRQSFGFAGGLKMTLDAPSLSEQQSEFAIEGELTQQVNRLTQSAVRQGKLYYGFSVSEDYGMKIQRSDGKSDLTLNSDVMDWQVDGVSSLYYDALANRLKFTGTLEGADGIFSGTIQGGSFVGGNITIGSGNNVFRAGAQGIWSGHDNFANAPFRVNMQGEMTAMTGTFGGTLQAAGGTFSGNLSAAGGTFTGELVAASGTFAGALQAATGTFSGDLSAAGGTFSGNLSAAGGTFTGTLQGVDGNFSGTITASTFTGGTITGALIQTSVSSYPRVELRSDAQMIRAATSANNSIDILAYHAGFPYIQYRNGSDVTDIWMQPEFFQIGGDKEIRLQTLSHISLFPSGDIFLYPGGTVRVQNWSRIINNTTGRTLAQDLAGGGFTGGVFVDSGGLTLVLDFENGLLINAYYAGS